MEKRAKLIIGLPNRHQTDVTYLSVHFRPCGDPDFLLDLVDALVHDIVVGTLEVLLELIEDPEGDSDVGAVDDLGAPIVVLGALVEGFVQLVLQQRAGDDERSSV